MWHEISKTARLCGRGLRFRGFTSALLNSSADDQLTYLPFHTVKLNSNPQYMFSFIPRIVGFMSVSCKFFSDTINTTLSHGLGEVLRGFPGRLRNLRVRKITGDDASLRALKFFMENILSLVVCVGIYVPLCREICSRAKLLHMARGETDVTLEAPSLKLDIETCNR